MRTCLRTTFLLGVPTVVLAVACGGSSSGGFAGQPGASAGPNDAGGSTADDSASPVQQDDSDAGGEIFTSSDSAAGVVFDCKPGTYSGEFTTSVGTDAGGLLALFSAFISFDWKGSLSVTLQGMVSGNSGGELPSPTLTIAPGAKLSGMDSMGGVFSADLSGQLDCPSKALTVTMTNGTYTYGGSTTIMMVGSMSATYDGTTTPPTLSMGAISTSSPQVMGIGANGSWSAALQ
jgi:hypothetical protein